MQFESSTPSSTEIVELDAAVVSHRDLDGSGRRRRRLRRERIDEAFDRRLDLGDRASPLAGVRRDVGGVQEGHEDFHGKGLPDESPAVEDPPAVRHGDFERNREAGDDVGAGVEVAVQGQWVLDGCACRFDGEVELEGAVLAHRDFAGSGRRRRCLRRERIDESFDRRLDLRDRGRPRAGVRRDVGGIQEGHEDLPRADVVSLMSLQPSTILQPSGTVTSNGTVKPVTR